MLAGAIFLIPFAWFVISRECNPSSHLAGHILVGLGSILGGLAVYLDLKRNEPKKIILALATILILYLAGSYIYSAFAFDHCGFTHLFY